MDKRLTYFEIRYYNKYRKCKTFTKRECLRWITKSGKSCHQKAVGRDNMVGEAHVRTRLRLVLKKTINNIDQAALDNNPDVNGTF